MENYAFIGGLVCVLYAGGACIAQGIADRKARKAQRKKLCSLSTQSRRKFNNLFKAKFVAK